MTKIADRHNFKKDFSRWLSRVKRNIVWLIAFLAVISGITYYNTVELHPVFANIVLAVAGSLASAAIFYFALKSSDDFRDSKLDADLEGIKEQVEIIPAQIDTYMRQIFSANIPPLSTFHSRKTPDESIDRSILQYGRHVHLTAMGINLLPLQSRIARLFTQDTACLHLLLPNPDCHALKELCEREGRTLMTVQQEIATLIQLATDIKNTACVEVRMTDQPSNTTILRIGDTIFWRPRLHDELRRDDQFCLEINNITGLNFFRIMRRELGISWDAASIHYNNRGTM